MASRKSDPVQGLVEFILDVKPYHSKIMDVVVEYVYSDEMHVRFTEQLEMDVILYSEPSMWAVCDDAGWAAYPWGLLDDNSDPFNVSGDPDSGYRTYQPYGTPHTISYWDNIGDCVPTVGPWTIYAKFTEEFSFSGSYLDLSDIINALVNDNQGLSDWDSTLKAKPILNFGGDTIELFGNQTLVGLLGNVGTLIAIHGSLVNDGTYTVIGATFDSITYRTYIQLDTPSSFNPSPPILTDSGQVGRAVRADSPYYWPEYGYELPVLYNPSFLPLDPLGWGLDQWGGNLSGPRMGAKIVDSWIITVDPVTNIFTLTAADTPLLPIPTFTAGQEVYLTTDSSLPDVLFGPTSQRIPLALYQPYYYIPVTSSPTELTFQLAYSLDGPALDVVNQGGGIQYIGIGQHINFLDIMMSTSDAFDTSYSESVGSDDEMMFKATMIKIVAIDIVNMSFTVQGDFTQLCAPGSSFFIQDSEGLGDGGNNNAWWTVADSPVSEYDVSTNTTVLYVNGPINDVNPFGFVQIPNGSILNAPAVTSFSESLDISVTHLYLTDNIMAGYEEESDVSVTELFLVDQISVDGEEVLNGIATEPTPGSPGYEVVWEI